MKTFSTLSFLLSLMAVILAVVSAETGMSKATNKNEDGTTVGHVHRRFLRADFNGCGECWKAQNCGGSYCWLCCRRLESDPSFLDYLDEDAAAAGAAFLAASDTNENN